MKVQLQYECLRCGERFYELQKDVEDSTKYFRENTNGVVVHECGIDEYGLARCIGMLIGDLLEKFQEINNNLSTG
jgi:hypothetical protein